MKKNVAILAFAVVVIAAMLYIGSNIARKRQTEARRTGSLAPGQVIGRAAPDFSLKTLDGKTLKLSDLRGKAVVLNFWATWCPPCKVELPWFVDLQKQYGPQGLQVVGISEDEGGKDKVAQFVKEMGVNYTIAVDDNSVSEKYGDVEDLPTTFYIDRNGKIVQFAMGLVDRDEIEQKMKAALAVKTSAGDWRSLGMRMYAWVVAVAALFTSTAAQPQSEFAAGRPSVQVVHIESTPLQKGKSATVTMSFRVAKGFHINSNHPNSELLIPTAVKLDAPTDLSLGNVQYPAGEQVSFAFAPDEKLSVYTGDFIVQATARTIGEIRAGSYRVHGELKYQACDNSACYPPKSMPIAFDIKVGNPPPKPHHNPAQSPNVHN